MVENEAEELGVVTGELEDERDVESRERAFDALVGVMYEGWHGEQGLLSVIFNDESGGVKCFLVMSCREVEVEQAL